jgi:hypothetical protein
MEYSEMQPIGELLKRERNIILKNADAASAKGFTMVPNFFLKSKKLSVGDKMTSYRRILVTDGVRRQRIELAI